MKVLVTGFGLLGTAIRKVCESYKDYDFVFADRIFDLTHRKRVKIMIEAYNPDIIIHTAAKVGGVKLNSRCQEDMFFVNSSINNNIIHEAAQHNVKKLVAFGSTCAFDPSLPYLTEDDIQAGIPYHNNFAYGYAKRMVEVQLRAAKEHYGMDYAYYVPCSIFGENDNFNLEDAHVVPSLIHKAYLTKQANEPLRVWGDGTPRRELLYAEDLAHIIIQLLDKDTESMLVSSGEEVSVRTMAESIANKIVWETDKPIGQLCRPLANTTKLKSHLNFPFTPFAEGIKKTVDWFNNNYPNVRK